LIKEDLFQGCTFNPETPTTGIIRLTSTADPDYDCITVAQTRIAMGNGMEQPVCVMSNNSINKKDSGQAGMTKVSF